MSITIGNIVDSINSTPLPEYPRVLTPFGNMAPTGLVSYRGFYEQLALIVKPNFFDENILSSEELRKQLNDAVDGKTEFHGWKGGTYRMHPGTYLWVVLDAGSTSDLVVKGVEEDGTLLTGPAPY